MMNKRVLISGASVAGPALAYWLSLYGFEVTVIEKAEKLRDGGQAVDFKGHIHRTVLERMGILEAVRAASIESKDGFIVDSSGRKIGVVPGAFAGGEINIPRGDLSKILYALSKHSCRYIFGDSITSLTEGPSGVTVTFQKAASATFDIVVGADGIHSNVRKLWFGPESEFVTYLGYYYALVSIKAGADDVMYNEPGKMVALGGSKAPAFFVFSSPYRPDVRDSTEEQKKILIQAFANCKWRTRELLEMIPAAPEFLMDSISRVRVNHYSEGRVVLLGDSAYGNALGGFGTGLALVGAYVLAGELLRAGGKYRTAFQEYEDKFRDYASISEKVNAGKLLAPSSKFGIRLRNLLFSSLSVFGPLMKLIDRPATNLKLEDYQRWEPSLSAGVSKPND